MTIHHNIFDDPVVNEITVTLKEWHKRWKILFLNNQDDLFVEAGSAIESLVDSRSDLIDLLEQQSKKTAYDSTIYSSPESMIFQIKKNILNQVDIGNKLFNLDIIPRTSEFDLVNPIDTSPTKLFSIYLEKDSSLTSVHRLDNDTNNATISSQSSLVDSGCDVQLSNHLQVSLTTPHLSCLPPDELIEIYFSVVELTYLNQSPTIQPVSEKFLVQIKNDEILSGFPRTVFANLGQLTNRELCLYIQVYRVGRMTILDGYKTGFSKQQSSYSLSNTQEVIANQTNRASLTVLSKQRHSSIGYYNSTAKYRRPFGATLKPLRDHSRNGNAKDDVMYAKISMVSNELDFTQIHEIISKRSHSFRNQSVPTIQLDLSTKFLVGPLDSILNTTITEKRGYPNIVMPGDFKNDLYVTLESGEFEKGGKSIAKNIEASISLIDKAGLTICDCISSASNCEKVSTFKSCVFYHSNSPTWMESIKINVPLSKFDDAHLRIEFRHCSTKEREKKFLGFSFLPLSDEDGKVIIDKTHELYLYKCDSPLLPETLDMNKYLSLPYGPKAAPTNRPPANLAQISRSAREIVTLSTFFLSTKLTQNSDLLNLLRWRELIKNNRKDFEEVLRKVLLLNGEDIVKFLQDILDTLFDTFSIFSESEDDYCALIFKVLVHIFLLLEEPRYNHFQPVLDTYVSSYFSATSVYKGLLACVRNVCLGSSHIVERHGPIQRCLKTIKYVFKFIVQSKILYIQAFGDENDETFVNDLRHLFRMFEEMLTNSNPDLIPIQETFLESFPATFDQLAKVISAKELKSFITMIGRLDFRMNPRLSRSKLIFMKETANCILIKNLDLRMNVTECFCRHMETYLEYPRNFDLCFEVLELFIVKIHDYHWSCIHRLHQQLTRNSDNSLIQEKSKFVMTVGEIDCISKSHQSQSNQLDIAIANLSKELEPFIKILASLLHLLDCLMREHKTDRLTIQKYCACLLTIFKLIDSKNFLQFSLQKRVDLQRLFCLFREFVGIYDQVNRDWFMMQLVTRAVLIYPIQELAKDILLSPDGPTTCKHASAYINLVLEFTMHPNLQLESFYEWKRIVALKFFGDLRKKLCNQLLAFWSNLSPKNLYDLSTTTVRSVLYASLSQNKFLQEKLIPNLFDLLNSEEQFNKSGLRQTERCLIENIDYLFFNLNLGDAKFVDNFDTILTQLIVERKPVWEDRGISLIQSVTKIMRLIVEYQLLVRNADNQSLQMSYLVDILTFYRGHGYTELYLKYLSRLRDIHVKLGNHVEAAFTIQLYTNELRWTDKMLGSLDGLLDRPAEQEWHRKETFYKQMVHHFDMAKCWEEAIPPCKDLASFYETNITHYEGVSSTLKLLATFFDKILTEHRPEREYFRVEFLGSQLPAHVRGKELIYRGDAYERLAVFMQRMQDDYPDAKILSTKAKQSIVKDTEGQYLVISNVKPVPNLEDIFKPNQRNISDKVIQYYMNNRVNKFTYDVPIIKDDMGVVKKQGDLGAEVSFRNLWVGRYHLKVDKILPNILPWSEVVSKEYQEINPIDNAIESLSAKNSELNNLISNYQSDPLKPVSQLTMQLQGVIEAAVNGGPSLFVKAFLRRPEASPNDSIQYKPEHLNHLRKLLNDQLSILKRGLDIHGQIIHEDMKPLHDRLVELLGMVHL